MNQEILNQAIAAPEVLSAAKNAFDNGVPQKTITEAIWNAITKLAVDTVKGAVAAIVTEIENARKTHKHHCAIMQLFEDIFSKATPSADPVVDPVVGPTTPVEPTTDAAPASGN